MSVSVQFSHSVVSDSLRPHGLQYARLPCPSPTPGAYSNSCPLSRWCHPAISSSVVPFSSCLQSFPASGSFPMSQFFALGGHSIGVSASASILPMYIQDWFPSGLIGLISLQSKGLSRVFSNTTVQKHKEEGVLKFSFLRQHNIFPKKGTEKRKGKPLVWVCSERISSFCSWRWARVLMHSLGWGLHSSWFRGTERGRHPSWRAPWSRAVASVADVISGPEHTFQLVWLAVPWPLILEIPLVAWRSLHFAKAVTTLSRRHRWVICVSSHPCVFSSVRWLPWLSH